MHAIFTKSESSKTSKPHVLILNLTDKIDLRRDEKIIPLSNPQHLLYIQHFSYNNNKFRISAKTLNSKIELPDGSYSMSDFQAYVKCILKKNMEKILTILQ